MRLLIVLTRGLGSVCGTCVDVNSIPLKLGKPLPKAGVFAHFEAQVVARNIACAVTGRGDEARFTGLGECFIETRGGKAGFGKGDFYAEPLPTSRSIRRPVAGTSARSCWNRCGSTGGCSDGDPDRSERQGLRSAAAVDSAGGLRRSGSTSKGR